MSSYNKLNPLFKEECYQKSWRIIDPTFAYADLPFILPTPPYFKTAEGKNYLQKTFGSLNPFRQNYKQNEDIRLLDYYILYELTLKDNSSIYTEDVDYFSLKSIDKPQDIQIQTPVQHLDSGYSYSSYLLTKRSVEKLFG